MATKIRNPKAYWARQQERQRKFDSKVRTAKIHLVSTLHQHHGGKLTASSWDAAFDQLIIDGALGAMASSRKTADLLKQHYSQPDSKLSKDGWHRRQYGAKVLEAAIGELVNSGEVSVSTNKRHIEVLANRAQATNDHPLYREYAEIVAAAELATVDAYISSAAKLVSGDAYSIYTSPSKTHLLACLPGSIKANLGGQWDWGEMVA